MRMHLGAVAPPFHRGHDANPDISPAQKPDGLPSGKAKWVDIR